MEVVIYQSPISSSKPGSTLQELKKSNRPQSHAGHSQHRLSLSDLGISLPTGGSSQAKQKTSSGESNGSRYGFKSQLTGKDSPILGYLYHRINGNIGYPPEIYDAWLEGEITAVLRFDSTGTWIEDPSAVQANGLGSRYLKVHLMRRLRALLAEAIPENLWRPTPKPFSVETRFVFKILAPEGITGAQKGPLSGVTADQTKFSQTDTDAGQSVEARVNQERQGAFGSSLLFYHSHLASKLAWKLGPFAGYGVMPSVGLDPGWFVKTIDDFLHHRAKIDPLERYHDDPEW